MLIIQHKYQKMYVFDVLQCKPHMTRKLCSLIGYTSMMLFVKGLTTVQYNGDQDLRISILKGRLAYVMGRRRSGVGVLNTSVANPLSSHAIVNHSIILGNMPVSI